MSEPRDPLRRVVVAGAGQVGVLAAIGIKRALPGAEVAVLGLARDPGALADHATTALPFTNRLHDRLGIDQDAILARAGGSHRLVTRYFGWGGPGQSGAAPYGAAVEPALRTRFAQEWGGGPRNSASGMTAASLAEVLADAGRFAVPPAGEIGSEVAALAAVEYALRWQPEAYHALLVEAAQRLGVSHVPGELAGIEPDGMGGIAALAVAGAERLSADLFLDCTGPSARLLAAMPGFALEDWSAELPLRRLILGRPGQGMLALEDRFSLLAEGWLGELAGRDGLRVALGVAEGVTEDAALRALGAPPLAAFQIEQGRARAPWLGNVVALGDAAARFEPLAHLNLDLAHRQLDLLLELLPGRAIEPLERAEYNRRSALMMDAVRDTLAAHYAAPAAQHVFGPALLSPGLASALDQFTRRGRLPSREEAALSGQELRSLLAALGFAPGQVPQAASVDGAQVEEEGRRFRHRAEAALAAAPPYAEFMTR
ncbi:MAG: tryptophan 7-halogenase [Altererythrobacter sp.]|nr:tryptophan 7-halogenase [Altererythrobacter sp.]